MTGPIYVMFSLDVCLQRFQLNMPLISLSQKYFLLSPEIKKSWQHFTSLDTKINRWTELQLQYLRKRIGFLATKSVKFRKSVGRTRLRLYDSVNYRGILTWRGIAQWWKIS